MKKYHFGSLLFPLFLSQTYGDSDFNNLKKTSISKKPKLSEEELAEIRNLPKKERKALMKKLKG